MMRHILTLNAGSSSIKFALFANAGELDEVVRGQVEGLGVLPHLHVQREGRSMRDDLLAPEDAKDHGSALRVIMRFLDQTLGPLSIAAVGHRVVHGGVTYAEPVILDDESFAALAVLSPLAPLHQPHNLSGVRAAQAAFPDAVQVACFDTAFHRAHPWVSDTYALPREMYERGIRRYGFHGLSYEYVVGALAAIAPTQAAGRVVVTHLGSGASMCAIRNGQSIGSSMGFTALDGLPMGTRCGQLDPGVVLYLMGEMRMTPQEVEDLLYRCSGLRGLSGVSNDMRRLEASDKPEARQAVDYFVDRVRRELGAMTAILCGLDALAFCGGIGENAWRIRERVCQGFDWLGLELDEARNRAGETIISAERARVRVFVIPTNEEMTIARHTARLLAVSQRQLAPV